MLQALSHCYEVASMVGRRRSRKCRIEYWNRTQKRSCRGFFFPKGSDWILSPLQRSILVNNL